MSASEIRVIKSKKSVMWTCINCEQFGNDLNSLKSAILALQDEVKALKSIRSSEGATLNNHSFEEILQEIGDRHERKCNLIVYGVKEQPAELNKEERLSETRVAVRVLKSVIPDFSPSDEFRPYRLGRFNPQNIRSRPLKITLPKEHLVREFVKNSKKLRQIDEFRGIVLSFDRTPRQIEYYRSVRKELDERKANGEENIGIKYVKGIPKIVENFH